MNRIVVKECILRMEGEGILRATKRTQNIMAEYPLIKNKTITEYAFAKNWGGYLPTNDMLSLAISTRVSRWKNGMTKR